MPEIRIVSSAEELESIAAFRYQVYVAELGKAPPFVDHVNLRLTDPGDETGIHFCAISDAGVIEGCGRVHLLDQPGRPAVLPASLAEHVASAVHPAAYISKLMVRSDRRGGITAARIVAAGYEYIRSTLPDCTVAICHCHPRLVPLYEKMGLRRFGQPFEDPHVGTQVPMVNLLEDVEHYAASGSFLLANALRHPRDPSRLAWARKHFLPDRNDTTPTANDDESRNAMPGIDSIIEQSQRNFAEVLARLLKNGPVTPIHYQRYLSMQYHLTRGVQRYFIAAAAHPDLVSRKRLRRFLFEFANEEELHYLVAANDLFRSALPLLPMPFDVELWHAYFNATVAERPFLRLGAACILENIAEGEAKPLVRRALAAPFLNRENTKFLVLHQHESLPHGAQLLDALGGAHLDEPQLADLLEGARKGAVFYLRMAEWALFPDCAAAAADARDGAVTAAERKAIEAFSMEQLAT